MTYNELMAFRDRIELKRRFVSFAEQLAGEGFPIDDVYFAGVRCLCWASDSRQELFANVEQVASNWFQPDGSRHEDDGPTPCI